MLVLHSLTLLSGCGHRTLRPLSTVLPRSQLLRYEVILVGLWGYTTTERANAAYALKPPETVVVHVSAEQQHQLHVRHHQFALSSELPFVQGVAQMRARNTLQPAPARAGGGASHQTA